MYYSVYRYEDQEKDPTGLDDKTSFAKLVFVKEAFTWPAFFFTGFWFIYRQQYIMGLSLLAVSALLQALCHFLVPQADIAVILIFSVLIGLEAGQLMALSLWMNGYNHVMTVFGHTLEHAEHAYNQAIGKDHQVMDTRANDIISADVAEQVS